MSGRDKNRERLERLQEELALLQHAYGRQGLKGIVALEGWDAAGKGGLIRRIGWALDPRPLRVWQISAPSAHERRQHWLQRFWERMPLTGEIAIFDRSWYGRVLVERIEGFATEPEWRRAYDEINAFERALVDSGIRVCKLFLDISPEEQMKRFLERYTEPGKRWKLTEDDIRNRAHWQAYADAYSDMVKLTSQPGAEWYRVDANDKHAARCDGLSEILRVLGKGVDVVPPDVPPLVKAFMEEQLRGVRAGK